METINQIKIWLEQADPISFTLVIFGLLTVYFGCLYLIDRKINK
jgi:hypothetical protein